MSRIKKSSSILLEKLKNDSIKIFARHPARIFNYKQIWKQLTELDQLAWNEEGLDKKESQDLKKILWKALEEMAHDGDLIETDRGKYKLYPVESFVEGKIDITSKGAAYVMNENFEDDIFIAPHNIKNALNGDWVKVSLFARREGKRQEGEIVEIIKRAKTEFAGTIQLSARYAFLVPDSNKMNVDIFIPLSGLNNAKHGEKAIARITEWNDEAKNPTGEIVKVLGNPGENETEMNAILVEYGFPLEFPARVEREADEIAIEITREEIAKRKDFRNTTTFTIDPIDAKDFDDALSIKKLSNGKYEIGVHIADVSHYVNLGTRLEEEAYNRATSIYLVDRVIPMLPEKLSNNVCSLRPHEDKLCYSAVFEMDEQANVMEEWFGRTIINSDRRFTYEEAQQVIETSEGDLKEEILLFDRLAKKLRAERFKKGAISFEKTEVKFHLDDKGNPTGVYVKESKDSNKLIEEFMLLANRKVAEFIGKNKAAGVNRKPKTENTNLTFVYRIHDSPVTDRLADFAAFAANFGYKIKTGSDKEIATSLNQLLKDVNGKKEQNVLEQLAIRTMAKAIYTTNNIGHYGLAFDYYTHFTSPIRRYPDVMVHRLLDYYLKGGKSADQNDYEKKCRHSTEMEIQAAEAERASIKYKQVQYLSDKKDRVFEGIISGVTEWGIYVELNDNKCEGMVRLRDIDDDYYEFDEKNYCIKGHRKRKVYQLGDTVSVVIKSTDLVKKQIDFLLYSDHTEKDSFKRSDKKRKKFTEKKKKRRK